VLLYSVTGGTECNNEFDMAHNGRNVCTFFSIYDTVVLKNIDPITLPYGTVYTDRRYS
jgi:hypothetical protein